MNTGLTTTFALLSGLLIAISIACDSTPASPAQPSADPTPVVPTPTAPSEPAATPVIPTPTTAVKPIPTLVIPTPTIPVIPIPTPVDTASPTAESQDESDVNAEHLREAQTKLDKHRTLWISNPAATYSFVLTPICFCPQDLLDPVTVLVVDGVVASVSYVKSGKAPEHDGYGRYVTIDELFDTIQEAIDGGASQITAAYDPQVGYPTDVRIDYDTRMADEEYTFTASAYTAGAPVPDGESDALEKAQAELDRYRALWSSKSVEAYSFVLTPICFCPEDFVVPVTIRVKGEAVASVTFVKTGRAPEHDGFGRYVTIDQLFDVIQEAIEDGASEVAVTYDPEFGYPTEARIDYDTRMADEEYMFTATDYSPGG